MFHYLPWRGVVLAFLFAKVERIQVQFNLLHIPHVVEVLTDTSIQTVFERLHNLIDVGNYGTTVLELFENFIEVRRSTEKKSINK